MKRIKLIEKRGELRRLAATQNKQLNSTASSEGRTENTSNEFEVPRCLARDFYFGQLSVVRCQWFVLATDYRQLTTDNFYANLQRSS